jgi:carbamoyltransferase
MHSKITWGISANSHDAALAVFNNDGLEFASHSERFSGVKNDAHLNTALIDYAKQWGEPDEIIWYERPFKKTLRQLWAGQGWRYNENNIKSYLKSYKLDAPIKCVDHHLSHAAAGYYTSNFRDATVICIDSIGEFETFTVWEAKDTELKRVYTQGYPHSIGLWYSAMTQRIGLKPNEDEYILMGMAAYGDPNRLYNDIKEHFVVEGWDLISTVATRFYIEEPATLFWENLHRGCQRWRPDLDTEQDMFDIAAATQKLYEDMFRKALIWMQRNVDSKNLVLMGGCALNCSANSIAYDYFDRVWIMPNPGDAGSAVGAVLAHKKQHMKMDHAFLGYDIKGEYPVLQTVKELAETGICGVANGKAEFGPRAFGNRSLLADPRGHDIKDRVNRIKRRQEFRPFAPVILEEYASDNFEGYYNNYMQYTSTCKHPDLYPAICHADGTSRVQTVAPDGSGIRRLLEAWHRKTGCPMLLNTSLNIKGKPIVNDLTDAQEFATMYGVKVFT